MPDELSPLIAQVMKYRSRLDRQSSADIARLIEAYKALALRLKDKVDLLTSDIAQIGIENITRADIAKMARYKDLINSIQTELAQYDSYLVIELDRIANAALAQAELDIQALTRLSAMLYDKDGNALDVLQIVGGFNKLPVESIKNLIGFLDPEGPLFQRILALAPLYAQSIAAKILEAVGLGYSPFKLGRMITNELGLGLSDAIRWARTTQMWTYRETTRASMAANQDVLDGWVWFAQLDGNTCGACLSEHGKVHPITDMLDGHWNCRCDMLPLTKGRDNPIEQSGEAWFNSQDEATQKQIMGETKWQAYKDGKFTFDQLGIHRDDNVFGTMWTEQSLKNLLGN